MKTDSTTRNVMKLSTTHRQRTSVGRRRFIAIAAAAAIVAGLGSVPALALPRVRASRAAVHLVDGWDRDLDLDALKRPVLLFYENKDSATQNQALKDNLAELQKSSGYRSKIQHVIVADTSPYDYWPAKGVAKGELRKWSKKLGIVVYSDFTTEVRTKLELEKDQSNVVLYSSHGDVLFAYAGAAPREQRAELIGKLKALL